MNHANHFSARVCRCFHSGKNRGYPYCAWEKEKNLYVLPKRCVHYYAIVFDWEYSEACMEKGEVWLFSIYCLA